MDLTAVFNEKIGTRLARLALAKVPVKSFNPNSHKVYKAQMPWSNQAHLVPHQIQQTWALESIYVMLKMKHLKLPRD